MTLMTLFFAMCMDNTLFNLYISYRESIVHIDSKYNIVTANIYKNSVTSVIASLVGGLF